MKGSVPRLCSRLDRELSWRKKELTSQKLLVQSPVPQQTLLLRSATLLLYAHWEGFVKNAAQLYVRFVAEQPRELARLAHSFVALAMRSDIFNCLQSRDASVHGRLVAKFRALEGPPPIMRAFGWQGAISTRSNLTYAVFRRILATISLPESPYSTRAKLVDRLVELRNGIAHGQGMTPTTADYCDMHDDVIAMLNTFRDDIEEAAVNARYLL